MELLISSRFIFRLSASANMTTTCRIICNSSIYGNKYVGERDYSSSPQPGHFGGYTSSGSYTKGPNTSDVFKRIYKDPKILLKACQIWKDEFKLWRKEWKDRLHNSPFSGFKKGEIDMLFTFEEEDGINKFLVVTDKSNNQGYSTASFVRTQNETGLFSGFIDTRVPDDGQTTNAGVASIITRRLLKSFQRFATYDWINYTHLVLKVRGDGRSYLIILGCPSNLDVTYQDQFHYPLFTRGGPYWQIAKIPLSNFYFTSKGRIQDQQEVMPYNHCSRVGITLADGNSGPFKLEIEYFGLEFQPYYKMICPYEHYAGKMIADL